MIVYAIAGVLAFVAILCIILPEKKKRFPKQYLHDNGRPLGFLEDAMRRFHDENGCLILANTLVLRTKKLLQESVVKKALELLSKRHPMLRMLIRKNNDGNYCFQKRHNVLVDLRQLDNSNWRDVMEESLLEKFDVENGPLWRFIFLPNARYEIETGSDVNDTTFPHECICIFCFHHSIIDGTSYSRLFAEFLHYLNKLNKNEKKNVRVLERPDEFGRQVFLPGIVVEKVIESPDLPESLLKKMTQMKVIKKQKFIHIQSFLHLCDYWSRMSFLERKSCFYTRTEELTEEEITEEPMQEATCMGSSV